MIATRGHIGYILLCGSRVGDVSTSGDECILRGGYYVFVFVRRNEDFFLRCSCISLSVCEFLHDCTILSY